MKRIIEKVFMRPTPGELASLDLSARKRRCIQEITCEALEKIGHDPASFDWLLPATELRMPGTSGSGAIADEGFVAARGSTLYAFGYVQGQLRIEEGALDSTVWELMPDRLKPALWIGLPFGRFQQARISLDSSCDYSAGPWWQALKDHTRSLTAAAEATLGMAHITLHEVQRDAFGLKPAGERRVAVCWVDAGFVNVWPDEWSFAVAQVVGWNFENETSVKFCISDSQGVVLVEIQQLTCGAEPTFVQALTSSLAALGPQEPKLRSVLELSGLFLGREVSHDENALIWLCAKRDKLKRNPFAKDEYQNFSRGYVREDHAVFYRLDGDAFAIRSEPAVVSKICETLSPVTAMCGSAEGPWGVFLMDGQAKVKAPVLVRVLERGLRVGATPDIPWGELVIEDRDDGTTDCETVR